MSSMLRHPGCDEQRDEDDAAPNTETAPQNTSHEPNGSQLPGLDGELAFHTARLGPRWSGVSVA